MLNTFIVESSDATNTDWHALSKIAQLAEVSPLSNCISSLTIRTSQIFVIPSQSADTILSPYVERIDQIIETTYPEIELAGVHCIIMSVESLDALTGPYVPHCHCLVSATTGKGLGVGQELNGVDRVDVASESESAFVHVQVPHLNSVVHRG